MRLVQKQRTRKTREQWEQPWPLPKTETIDADTSVIDEVLSES